MEDGAFAEVISASAFLLALLEVAHVFVLVEILEASLAVGQVIDEFPGIAAAIAVDHPPFALFMVVMEQTDVIVLGDLVDMIPVSFPHAIAPLAFLQHIFAVVNAIAVFEVVLPGSIVVGNPVVVEVDSSALHDSVVDQPVEDLSIREDIDALSVEDVILP